MSLILCTKACTHQKEGLCALAHVTTASQTPVDHVCPYSSATATPLALSPRVSSSLV